MASIRERAGASRIPSLRVTNAGWLAQQQRTPSKKANMDMNAETRVQGGLDTRSSSPGRKIRLTFKDAATALKHTVPALASS